MSRRTPLRRILLITVLPLMAVAVFSCARIEERVLVPRLRNAVIAPRPVRVLVGIGTANQPLEISAIGDVDVWNGDASAIVDTIQIKKAAAGFYRGTVTVAGRGWGLPAVILVPRAGDRVSVKGYEYPGDIVLVAVGDSVAAINYVPIEEYIAGVVSCEMPAYFGRAALQAQAVAARSYVLWQMKENRLGLYDVRNDEYSQVYHGAAGTNDAGKQAAERTAGAILIYDWKFLQALYFSTCGGHTISAAALPWAPQIPPFRGVPCDYCRASKRYKWPLKISSQEMEQALAKGNFLSGRLLDVCVVKAFPGGWVDTVEVSSENSRRQIAGRVLRQALGTSRLYSTKFTIRKIADDYIFEGFGYGHGCGMCQWGADGMARAGRNYADILRYYYPGAEILKIY